MIRSPPLIPIDRIGGKMVGFSSKARSSKITYHSKIARVAEGRATYIKSARGLNTCPKHESVICRII